MCRQNGTPLISQTQLIKAKADQNAITWLLPRDGIAVVLPLIVAIGIIFGTVLIHAFALIATVHHVRRERQRARRHPVLERPDHRIGSGARSARGTPG